MIKILFCIAFCIGGIYCGGKISEEYKRRLKIIDESISLAERMRSAVEYSGESLYRVTEKEKYVFLEKDCDEKKFCTDKINKAVKDAEDSNGIQSAVNIITVAKKELEEYKTVKGEEYRGKIKVMPSLGLSAGLLVSVLVL